MQGVPGLHRYPPRSHNVRHCSAIWFFFLSCFSCCVLYPACASPCSFSLYGACAGAGKGHGVLCGRVMPLLPHLRPHEALLRGARRFRREDCVGQAGERGGYSEGDGTSGTEERRFTAEPSPHSPQEAGGLCTLDVHLHYTREGRGRRNGQRHRGIVRCSSRTHLSVFAAGLP